ncbi:Metallo-dependent phosphatase [Cucurbitaria berberidis CBS 394.84]|uniref:Metallo-dependent phosphatase n=1 Tax=Cucurbitaria berberidis CBS 394.84 TaxID=1168544 RepID=A0A9P4LEM0_9PLEO|nr:Metallo-dependent phosphatase [Cucurbitaria berberidis CBS 394.84]KAF1851497.1 Metallo-dependent phosphatase [Cucurbitaria berberidis CBS 394.84]
MKRMQLLWLFASMTAGTRPLIRAKNAATNYPGIQFGGDRKLSITVFSDLHFGEPESARGRHDADFKTINTMKSVLNNEQPNLVVLNGDLTSCEWVAPENANSLVDQIVAPLVERNIPFATTWGNHDASKTCSTRLMSEHMWDMKGTNGKKLSFTTSSVPGEYGQVGTSNYLIPVYSSSDASKLEMLLWFFDSKGGRVYQPNGGDMTVANWVDDKVVSWFRQSSNEFRQQYGRVVPSLAFVHIPVHAARAFQKDGGRTGATEPGLDEELIGHQGDVCDNNDNCNYNGADTPFMKALIETEGLMAVFSGHDHGVDWCMKWSKSLPYNDPTKGNGLNLCFNRHSGYGGYTDWKRGARQIVIEQDKLGKNELETWIRLEDGDVSGHVMLNATYGVDHYPKVDKLKSFVSYLEPKPAAVFAERPSSVAKPKPKSKSTTASQTKLKSTMTTRPDVQKPKTMLTKSKSSIKPTAHPKSLDVKKSSNR